jgi:putative ATP-binding cassette transporter
MQAVNAFSYVQNALSFIINSYNDMATWEAVTQRLGDFEERLLAIQKSVRAPQLIVIRRSGGTGVAVDQLDLDLPDGTPLLRRVAFAIGEGDALLITGPSGSGKSTLLRAIAGGLGELAHALDKVEDWSARLSLGEQQGIVFARILLTKPTYLFLDEATSALDETAETHLLGLLRTKSWRPTVVSVGHGAVLRKFHEQTVDLSNFEPTKEAVVTPQ